MPALQMGLDRHLNAYHQSSPLLLQFALAEFLHVHQLFIAIQARVYEQAFDHSLLVLMTKLSGPSLGRVRVLSPGPDQGSLSKLYHYIAFLFDKVKNEYGDFPLQEKTAKKCWMLASQLTASLELEDFHVIPLRLKKLLLVLRQLAREIVKAIGLFKNNENVLFFMVRHVSHFDSIYGNKFTVNLFRHLFAGGLDEVEVFLIEKYSERGFHRLVENIKRAFEVIKD